MRVLSKCLVGVMTCGVAFLGAVAQCPKRPQPGTLVHDPYSISSQNGVLSAEFVLGHSVDDGGFTHYCYNYKTPDNKIAESPTLRLNQGDELKLNILNRISDENPMKMKMPPNPQLCGGGSGDMTISTTNVHFHGLNVPPKCHQDDVINTYIQPGDPAFEYHMQIPANEPPGLYWYHPHVHGFTEFQVNGGAAGALVVEGMEKYRPEVAGLTERVLVVRQQYLVPWIPGPYQLTLNYEVDALPFPPPVIQMKPNEKQFWRVANATLQDFMPIQFQVNGVPQQMELIAMDGYPLAAPRKTDTILIPPAGRAEFIVQGPPQGDGGTFYVLGYSTGPTGNPDIEQRLATIQLSNNEDSDTRKMPIPTEHLSISKLKFAGSENAQVTATRKLFFSEEFGGTNGPIQFYITVDGQKQKVFEANEKPAIVTKVGAVEDWLIENRALETHAFHIHQIHFRVLEVDGKPVQDHDLRDTIEIPFWEGRGPFHSVKVRMDFSDPNTAGTFVFHCHILLHEDLGMMHKILVEPN